MMIVRKATIDDAKWILNVRNNETIRMVSLEKEIIPLEQHIKRFSSFIWNEKNICIIAEDNGVVAGYCRIADKEWRWLASIAILPTYQWRWLWKTLLSDAVSRYPKGQEIIAEIIETNLASINLFEKIWFTYIGKENTICSYLYKTKND
jgi:ribosomal protein S18 acetylase RimI-like enzyme